MPIPEWYRIRSYFSFYHSEMEYFLAKLCTSLATIIVIPKSLNVRLF